MNKIILASASPRRRELLRQIGMEFAVIPSTGEEYLPNREKLAPHEIVESLSEQKAMEVFERLSEEEKVNCIVAGADTVAALENQIMGKPRDKREACAMLSQLQGRVHQVYTGVTLLQGQGAGVPLCKRTFYEKTEVTMYPMTEAEIIAYVDTGEPMDKAGAYGIQGKCAAFIKEICGDYNNVVGLPVGRLYQEMKSLW
ncbi:MAG: Maf family protein [Clostridium sp.]|nr:Maf family protein [Clostridium sp.]